MGLVWLAAILLVVVAVIVIGLLFFNLVPRKAIVAAALLLTLAAAAIVLAVWSDEFHNDHYAVCHVLDKDRGNNADGYRVYTSECDTLVDEDAWWQGKFNSSNLWAQIKPGHTYRFRIVGSRIPIFNQFANILEVEEVTSS